MSVTIQPICLDLFNRSLAPIKKGWKQKVSPYPNQCFVIFISNIMLLMFLIRMWLSEKPFILSYPITDYFPF